MSRWMRLLAWFGLAPTEEDLWAAQNRRLDGLGPSPYTLMLECLKPVKGVKVQWLEDELFPRLRTRWLGWARFVWVADWAWSE